MHASTVPVPLQSGREPPCTLELKVIPNAPRDEVAGWLGAALKVKIHAPALEGRANEALLKFLAVEVGVGVLDLGLDLVDPSFDLIGLAATVHNGGVILGDHHFASMAKLRHLGILEFEAQLFADALAAGEDGDVF